MPELVVPVANRSSPEDPELPAFDVLTLIAPLLVALPVPLTVVTTPPELEALAPALA